MEKLDSQIRTGGCQCGAIRFRANGLRDNPHICHCRMCQKAFGSFFAPLVGVYLTDFEWTRGIPAFFESSLSVQRGFCSKCGTPLYFQSEGNEHISIAIGAFDDPKSIPLAFELSMESKLPQIDQMRDLPNFGTTEEGDPDGAALARRTNQQHPDFDR